MARTRLKLELGLALLVLGAAHVAAASSNASDGREGEVPGVGPEKRTIVAGEQYRAGGFYRFLFGADYRDLWTTPCRCRSSTSRPSRGASRPFASLATARARAWHSKGRTDARTRSGPLLKDATGLLPVELRESKARDFVQDQMASGHPAGHVMVGPLLDAVGILHNNPRLVIMADSPALGEFRKDVRERSRRHRGVHGDARASGARSRRIDGEEMWKRLREGPAVRADSRSYLKARLIDQLIGDWDRHRNQWRWARVAGKERWQPIPEDRDQAFVRFEGLAIGNLRPTLPLLDQVPQRLSSLHGLTFDGWDVDKRILADLEKPVWDEVAREVQAALGDSVLESAVRAMPPEYFPKDGARLLAGLKSRRDKLPEQADRFYRFINGTVDVFCTDQAERVAARRESNGDLELTVGLAAPGSEPYFRRRFRKAETAKSGSTFTAGTTRSRSRAGATAACCCASSGPRARTCSTTPRAVARGSLPPIPTTR